MDSSCVTGALPPVGFPIRKSPGQSLFSGSPKLIAAYHVLHRLSLPRHPPYALSSLTIKKANLINTAVHTSRNGSRHFGATYKSLYAIVKERKPKERSTFYVEFQFLTWNGERRTGSNGGGERDRTDDPLRARQVLSQLSYTPG